MQSNLVPMSMLKAIVSGGRAIIEDVGDYPDGTELELAIVEDGEMSDESRTRLHAAIRESMDEPKSDRVSADVLLREMRAQLG